MVAHSANPRPGTVLEPGTIERVQLAPMYKVLIHNDDVTPMDFVIHILTGVFQKDLATSIDIMLEAHHSGVALVVVVPLERAEFLVDKAHSLARTAKFPLTFTYEPDE